MIRKYNLLGKQINNELEKTYLIAKLKNITKKKNPRKSFQNLNVVSLYCSNPYECKHK